MDPRSGITSISVPSSGGMRGMLVPLLAGDYISALSVCCISAGSGASLTKMALYDEHFNLLAQTADFTASLATNTWISAQALDTPYTQDRNGIVYFALLSVYSTTAPTFAGGTVDIGQFGVIPNSNRSIFNTWSQTGLAAFPATATPTTGNGNIYIAGSG